MSYPINSINAYKNIVKYRINRKPREWQLVHAYNMYLHSVNPSFVSALFPVKFYIGTGEYSNDRHYVDVFITGLKPIGHFGDNLEFEGYIAKDMPAGEMSVSQPVKGVCCTSGKEESWMETFEESVLGSVGPDIKVADLQEIKTETITGEVGQKGAGLTAEQEEVTTRGIVPVG